jgi:hypothetical protein
MCVLRHRQILGTKRLGRGADGLDVRFSTAFIDSNLDAELLIEPVPASWLSSLPLESPIDFFVRSFRSDNHWPRSRLSDGDL